MGQKAKLPPEMEATAEPLILKAGQISLHDVYLLHGSEPNESDLPRRGMTLRYLLLSTSRSVLCSGNIR